MSTTPITLSIDPAQLLEAFRCIVRQELAALQQAPFATAPAATGGIELARRSHAAE